MELGPETLKIIAINKNYTIFYNIKNIGALCLEPLSQSLTVYRDLVTNDPSHLGVFTLMHYLKNPQSGALNPLV